MAAGSWNTRVDRGAVWRRTLRYTDSAGTPIAVQAPGFMDIRAKADPESALIARLDATGSATGEITFGAEPGSIVLFLDDSATQDIPTGQYYFDLFVSDSDENLVKLVQGIVTVRTSISVP